MASRLSCDDNVAPCVMYSGDYDCSDGILSSSGEVCCDSGCINDDGDQQCGGTGCGKLPGGGANCCGGNNKAADLSCDDHDAPCVMYADSSDVFAWLGFDRFEWYYTAERWMIEVVLGVMVFLVLICISCCILQRLYRKLKVYCGKPSVYEKVRMVSESEQSDCDPTDVDSWWEN